MIAKHGHMVKIVRAVQRRSIQKKSGKSGRDGIYPIVTDESYGAIRHSSQLKKSPGAIANPQQ